MKAYSRWDPINFVVRFLSGLLLGIALFSRFGCAYFYYGDNYPEPGSPWNLVAWIGGAFVFGTASWWFGDGFWEGIMKIIHACFHPFSFWRD